MRHERSFSAAARRLHRTQPAISQAVRRLEDELGEQLFDRSSHDGTLTEAGRLLQNYGQRLLRLAEEAEIGGPRAAQVAARPRAHRRQRSRRAHACCRYIERFRQLHPDIAVDVRRVPARQIAGSAAGQLSTSAC